jgi:pimeloyl-ACP methyl ester carboxylesterase
MFSKSTFASAVAASLNWRHSLFRAAAALALTAIPALAHAGQPAIVLVHGMNADGSTWRPVHDALVKQGYEVAVAQLPLNGFEGDVEAVERVLDREGGDVLLVGHSYGGVVITAAGNRPSVKGLVYVAALQPDVGDTMGSLNQRMPSAFDPAGSSIDKNGYLTVTKEAFRRDTAPDHPASDAEFLADAQTPTTTAVFTAPTKKAAWRGKPSFGIVAKQDRVVSPDLQRWMYRRAGSTVSEIDGSHMLILSHPGEVAASIAKAARTIGQR